MIDFRRLSFSVSWYDNRHFYWNLGLHLKALYQSLTRYFKVLFSRRYDHIIIAMSSASSSSMGSTLFHSFWSKTGSGALATGLLMVSRSAWLYAIIWWIDLPANCFNFAYKSVWSMVTPAALSTFATSVSAKTTTEWLVYLIQCVAWGVSGLGHLTTGGSLTRILVATQDK